MDLPSPTPWITQTLAPHVVAWSLVLFRVAGLFVFAPLLTSAMVPMRFKALLAALLAGAAYPLVASRVQLDLGSMPEPDVLTLLPMVVGEALVGLAMGAIAAVPLLMMELAGTLAGTTMGFGLARIYNPEADADTDILGQLYFFLASGIFVAIGGLDQLFRGILASLERVPVGGLGGSAGSRGGEVFVGVLQAGTELGLRVAAPVVAIVLLLIIVFGVIGKTMPQLNVMSVGFSIKLLCGVGVIAMGLSSLHASLADSVAHAVDSAAAWMLPREVAPTPGDMEVR
jgi:flagellar biosynthetic protein FliR